PIYGHEWRNSQATKIFDSTKSDSDKFPAFYDQSTERWINTGYNDDGVDQIFRLMQMLSDPDARKSRRLIVSGWNPRDADNVSLPPCHTLFHLKWHEDSNELDL